jgi:hypothetical protein
MGLEVIENKCPECKSSNINSFRMPYGPKWCKDCGFRVEQKELHDPFYKVIWEKDSESNICGGMHGCENKKFEENDKCNECLKDYTDAIDWANKYNETNKNA